MKIIVAIAAFSMLPAFAQVAQAPATQPQKPAPTSTRPSASAENPWANGANQSFGPWAAESRRRAQREANPRPAPRSVTICHRIDDDMVTCSTY